MNRLFAILMAALVVSFPAFAGSNIVQKDTGATVWQDADGNEVPVGDSGLTLLVTDVSTAATHYVVSNKAGKITKVYSGLHGAITGSDATLYVMVANSTTPSIFDQVTPNGTLTITQSGSATGDVDTASPTGANTVSQGQVIAIYTDGASTNTVGASITIVIE